MTLFNTISNKIKFCLLVMFSVFFVRGISYATDDLLKQVWDPSYYPGTVVKAGERVDSVGGGVIHGKTVVTLEGATERPPLIAYITRILLVLTITLSVTMILYNGMVYIIETGQGKESKNLIKNVAYIVVGILIALFSVIIIAIIQSSAKTIDSEIDPDTDNQIDKSAILSEK